LWSSSGFRTTPETRPVAPVQNFVWTQDVALDFLRATWFDRIAVFEGYTGELCDTEIDECFEMKPCMNGSTCVDEIANYTCLCREGLGGRNCSVALTGC